MVIPVRNGESTLADQLHALYRQEAAPPFEVIVADNGSTDRTVEIAEALSSSAPVGVELIVVDCSQRVGVSIVIVLFVVGMAVLFTVDESEGSRVRSG